MQLCFKPSQNSLILSLASIQLNKTHRCVMRCRFNVYQSSIHSTNPMQSEQLLLPKWLLTRSRSFQQQQHQHRRHHQHPYSLTSIPEDDLKACLTHGQAPKTSRCSLQTSNPAYSQSTDPSLPRCCPASPLRKSQLSRYCKAPVFETFHHLDVPMLLFQIILILQEPREIFLR